MPGVPWEDTVTISGCICPVVLGNGIINGSVFLRCLGEEHPGQQPVRHDPAEQCRELHPRREEILAHLLPDATEYIFRGLLLADLVRRGDPVAADCLGIDEPRMDRLDQDVGKSEMPQFHARRFEKNPRGGLGGGVIPLHGDAEIARLGIHVDDHAARVLRLHLPHQGAVEIDHGVVIRAHAVQDGIPRRGEGVRGGTDTDVQQGDVYPAEFFHRGGNHPLGVGGVQGVPGVDLAAAAAFPDLPGRGFEELPAPGGDYQRIVMAAQRDGHRTAYARRCPGDENYFSGMVHVSSPCLPTVE